MSESFSLHLHVISLFLKVLSIGHKSLGVSQIDSEEPPGTDKSSLRPLMTVQAGICKHSALLNLSPSQAMNSTLNSELRSKVKEKKWFHLSSYTSKTWNCFRMTVKPGQRGVWGLSWLTYSSYKHARRHLGWYSVTFRCLQVRTEVPVCSIQRKPDMFCKWSGQREVSH